MKAIAQSKGVYEALDFKAIHWDLLDWLPRKGGKILDIGCGSARDALGFKSLGYDVTAVDPNVELISSLNAEYRKTGIKFAVDKLPKLVHTRNKKFDLIMMTGVWHFMTPETRLIAMDTVSSMLNYKGSIVIYLKRDYNASDCYESEIRSLADMLELRLIHENTLTDVQNREGIYWKLLKFKNKQDPIFNTPSAK